jgi:hypothetical protein
MNNESRKTPGPGSYNISYESVKVNINRGTVIGKELRQASENKTRQIVPGPN